MPIQNTTPNLPFDLARGIEGVAQSPPRSNSLNVLPASTRVMPSAQLHTGLHTGQGVPGAENIWLHASSQWDAHMAQFLTPQGLSPELLLPSVLRARLDLARVKATKAAREQKSAPLRALVDVLEDDQLLRDMLEQYRSALIKA